MEIGKAKYDFYTDCFEVTFSLQKYPSSAFLESISNESIFLSLHFFTPQTEISFRLGSAHKNYSSGSSVLDIS